MFCQRGNREGEKCLKLKGCQNGRIREYKNQGPYIECDKVWYQYHDSNAWLGPAVVISHKHNKFGYTPMVILQGCSLKSEIIPQRMLLMRVFIRVKMNLKLIMKGKLA